MAEATSSSFKSTFISETCTRILAGRAVAAPGAISDSKASASAAKATNPYDDDDDKGKQKKKKSSGLKIDTDPVKGTRDFLPDDMMLQSWLFGKFRDAARSFGFREYDAPVLENMELYRVKAGSVAEELTEQMFSFVDKAGREVTLRPEMTPSLARLVLQDPKLLLPIKWYAIPQCWRYERMTRGRRREHYQWNMDIFGESFVTAEAELLAAIVGFFRSVGLTAADVGIRVNSRKVLQHVLEPLGVTAELFKPVVVVVDKLDKLSEAEIKAQLAQLGLTPDVRDAIMRTLGLKSLDALAEILGADSEPVVELRALFDLCASYGIGDFLVFDASVVRGLAYYTGVVFEGFDRAGTLRAICGGGRYDDLLDQTFGAKTKIPAVGFGFGDCVVVELLSDKGLLPKLVYEVDALVIPTTESARRAAIGVVAQLRAAGLVVDVFLKEKVKLDKAFSYADRVGARRVVLVNEQQIASGNIRVKNMRLPETHADKQVDMPLADLVPYLQRPAQVEQ